jgi:HD superfamily phosphohydrolase
MASQFEADSRSYHDPLYGDVVLRPVFRDAINLRAMQRLRHLKQLDVLDMVFPGATHTRLEHSVGVFKVASDMINHLVDLQFDNIETRPPIRVPHVVATQLAALFHDVGCGPLSGIFDAFCRYEGYRAWGHENVTKKLITEGIGEFNDIPMFLDELLHSFKNRGIPGELDFLRPENIASMSQGEPPPADPKYLFLSQIVSSSTGADRIDYLQRDAFHTIGEMNLIPRQQIIDNITMGREGLLDGEIFALRVNKEAAPAVEALLSARELMHRRVYFNRRHRGHQELLIRAFKEVAPTLVLEDLVMKTDAEVFDLLSQHNSFTRNVALRLIRGNMYVPLPFDIQVYHDLGEHGRQRWAELRSLKREEVFAAEKHLASELSLNSETVVFVLDEPALTLKSDYFGTNLYDPDTGQSVNLVDVLPHLLLTRGTLSDRLSDRLIDLGRTYVDMLSYFNVFVPQELHIRVAESVKQIIKRLPKEPSEVETHEIVREELSKQTSPLRIVFSRVLDLLLISLEDREALWNRCLPSLSRQIEGLVKFERAKEGEETERAPPLAHPVDLERPVIQNMLDADQLAKETARSLDISNLLIDRLVPGFKMFRSATEIGTELATPCTNQDDFRLKIGAMASLFEVGTEALGRLLKNSKQEWKSVRMIEEWMAQMGVEDWDRVTLVWKRIIDFRNASFPYHATSVEFVELVKYFGGGFPVDYRRLWRGVLQGFHQSLVEWQKLLANLNR